MEGYTKIYGRLLDSTIWTDGDKETRLVWVTMLLMKGRNQVVVASVPGLAKRAGVTVEECEKALKFLKAPDPYSMTQDHDGRRILDCPDGGWQIINGTKYRDLKTPDDVSSFQADKQKRYRDRKKGKKIRLPNGETPQEREAGENPVFPPRTTYDTEPQGAM